ncbi:MAG: hypothetical protein QOE42_1572 [Chloroflexota bacterium]|jgi:uncharacterized small protein (DUF1192 family)|nr:hypothetical protein [Chloroflexota bacterium]
MTSDQSRPTLSDVDDLLDLWALLQKAVARRDAERPRTPAWRAAEAEIEALTRRVWQVDEALGESPPEPS